jgi:shikimate dehydrogenase
MSVWSRLFGRNADSPLTAVRTLVDSGLVKIAAQPKNNALNLNDRRLKRLYVFLIDHDYPGGSAAMHNAVFANYRLPYRSCFMVGDPKNIAEIFAGLKHCSIYSGGGAGSGFKDKIPPLLDDLDASAKTIGSVNVIARNGARCTGYNTDGVGFVAGLEAEHRNAIAGKKVVILGAGGTALPISYEIARCKPSEVVIVNRTISKGEAIAQLIKPFAPARAVGEDVLGDELVGAGLVVNTSNKGAQPNEKFSAFAAMTGDVAKDMEASKANLKRLSKGAIVADILLEDQTLTLKMAKDAGFRTHSGRHMNLYQAVPAFKILTGLDKPDRALLRLMRKALGT